jgi:ABC-type multidrug transport system ATPase subunit
MGSDAGKDQGRRTGDGVAMRHPDPVLERPLAGTRIVARGLTTFHPDGTPALDDVHIEIRPGAVTAVIGPSGAGKTTLLAALAAVAPAQVGTVHYETVDDRPVRLGYVPQDEILHLELPLRRTLRYAAALRLDGATAAELDEAVDRVLRTLGLQGVTDVRVGDLSGGQRKRASIACELLTRPAVCFLDEPTSGLDPAAAAALLDDLHDLAAAGSTIVLTTHSVADVQRSDQVVVVAAGGRIVAVGTHAEVLTDLGVRDLAGLYRTLSAAPARPLRRIAAGSGSSTHPGPGPAGCGTSAFRQWAVLTRRVAETLVRNPLTMAITLGSPVAVTAMFVVLFRPGALRPGGDPTAGVQVAYWLAFAGFFFGLTFGLLQVCTEIPVLRRERHAGVRTGPYVLSKVAVLAPLLLLVDAVLVVALRATDRLPVLDLGDHLALQVTMGLHAVTALCLGLTASALVGSTAQAALALPMLCFPAVLFAGAVVPVPVMAAPGKVLAAAMPDRWAFEAIAQQLHVGQLAAGTPHASLGASSLVVYWLLLSAFAGLLAAGAHTAVRRRAR